MRSSVDSDPACCYKITMNNAKPTRSRINLRGYDVCLCRMCNPYGAARREAKRKVTRMLRRSEAREVLTAWQEAATDDMSDD
jgi:hypothetical protein